MGGYELQEPRGLLRTRSHSSIQIRATASDEPVLVPCRGLLCQVSWLNGTALGARGKRNTYGNKTRSLRA